MSHDPKLNGPTASEQERLALLIEECCEIGQACTKTLRHGWDSCHPNNPARINRELLRDEVVQLLAVLHLMLYMKKDFFPITDEEIAKALEKKLTYCHFQDMI